MTQFTPKVVEQRRPGMVVAVVAIAVLVVVAALAGAWRARSEFLRSAFAPGDQVVIDRGHPSLGGARGTVRLPPPFAAGSGEWAGHLRRVHERDGSVKILYWIELQQGGRGVEVPEGMLHRVGSGGESRPD